MHVQLTSTIRRFGARALLVFATLITSPAIAQAETISVSTSAATALAPVISDLQRYLGTMLGRTIVYAPGTTNATLSLVAVDDPQIPADVAAALNGRSAQAFALKAKDGAIHIYARDERGLSNGAYTLLERLDVRFLLPADHWTIVPRRGALDLLADDLIEPDFVVREYSGTGGFYSAYWGRNYEGSALYEHKVTDWKRRLRYGGDFALGKHMGDAFIKDASVTPILEQHPEYLAKIGGQFSPLRETGADGKLAFNETAKINAGNPEAVSLFCDWIVREFKQARAGSDKRYHKVISVEPSDGYGYGDNVAELAGNGSGSDQSYFIANRCAEKVRAIDPEASVIILAYAGHADPPSFPLERNVIVQVTPYAFQDTEPQRFIAQWQNHAPRMAIYDYWSMPDWTRDEPSFAFTQVGQLLRRWNTAGIDAMQTESTLAAGPMGLSHYIASHLMWKLGGDVQQLFAEWTRLAFGAGAAPMQRMMLRWNASFRLTSIEMAATFGDLSEARSAVIDNSDEARRIDDFIFYADYLRRRLEVTNARVPSDKNARSDDLTRYLLSINDRLMVSTTRIIDLETRTSPDLLTRYRFDANGQGPGWAEVTPLPNEAAQRLLAEDRAAYPKEDFGTPTAPPPALQRSLAPVSAGTGWQPWFPTIDHIVVELDVPQGAKSATVEIRHATKIEATLFDTTLAPVGDTVLPAPVDGAKIETLSFPVTPGTYALSLNAHGGRSTGYFDIRFETQTALRLIKFLSPKSGPAPTLYFRVPRGLKRLVLFYPDTDYSGALGLKIRSPSGDTPRVDVRDGRRVLVVDVPPGTDGGIWSIERSVSPDESFELLNAPQIFSLTPETVP